ARVVAMRIDAAVRPERDAHSRLHRLGETIALSLRGLFILAQDFLAPMIAPADLLDVVAVIDVGHQPRAVLLHQRNAFIIEIRGMFNGAHAGSHRPLYSFSTMRMGRDEDSILGRFVDRGSYLRFGIFGSARCRARSEDRTR